MLKQMSGKTFSNLLSYYIACLEQEDMLSVTFKVSSEGTAFLSTLFRTELLFHENNKQVMVKNTEGIKKFFQTSLLQHKNKTLFYGYPVIIAPEGLISPLFFTELQFEQKDDAVVFTRLSTQQNLNHYLLTNNNISNEETLHIQQETEGEAFLTALETICKTLHMDSTCCVPTLDDKPLKRTIEPTLLNKVIIYFGERTDISRSLIIELSQLQKKTLDELSSTSLLCFLTGEYQSERVIEDDTSLLEVFSLNPAQEQAVRQALHNPVTLITGPPGTGKTQVVLNLIANAVYNDKTVLFASKNNKAVDVVTDKIDALLGNKLLMRMGNKTHRRAAKTDLEHLISHPIQTIPRTQDTLQNLHSIKSEMSSVKQQIRSLMALNESIDALQVAHDSCLKKLPFELLKEAGHYSLGMIDLKTLQNDRERCTQRHGIFQNFYQGRHKKKLEQCLRKYVDVLPTNLKKILETTLCAEQVTKQDVLELIYTMKEEEVTSEELRKIQSALLTSPSYPYLNNQLVHLHKDCIVHSRLLFQQHWINKFYEADDRDTQHMISYFSCSEQLESWVGDHNTYRQLCRQRLTMMQQSLRFLPVWVVTNLSVKNSIPLKNNLFDILIIDEASQCDIASAIPLLYRAKHIVIIGDPQQLRHISLLSDIQDRSLAAMHSISDELFADASYAKHSLYDLVDHIVHLKSEQPVLLNEHYRCHPDIVSFSNEYFYGKKLTIATDQQRLLQHPSLQTRIVWHHVKGTTVHAKSPYNEEEAERVVEELLRILDLLSTVHASVGVVSLFRAQTEMITEKLQKFQEIIDADITIGTAHRFQGDEKDIIIFSPAVSQGVKTGTLHWIQTTNQLINVAVTRARSLLIIVGDQEVCRCSTGPLKNLSEYVEMTITHECVLASPVKQMFYDELQNESVPVLPNYLVSGATSFQIDFALFVNGRRYAIIIDKDLNPSDKKKLVTDGWKLRWLSEQDIHENLKTVVEEIKRLC